MAMEDESCTIEVKLNDIYEPVPTQIFYDALG